MTRVMDPKLKWPSTDFTREDQITLQEETQFFTQSLTLERCGHEGSNAKTLWSRMMGIERYRSFGAWLILVTKSHDSSTFSTLCFWSFLWNSKLLEHLFEVVSLKQISWHNSYFFSFWSLLIASSVILFLQLWSRIIGQMSPQWLFGATFLTTVMLWSTKQATIMFRILCEVTLGWFEHLKSSSTSSLCHYPDLQSWPAYPLSPDNTEQHWECT